MEGRGDNDAIQRSFDPEHVAQIISNLLSQAILWPMYGICVLQLYYEQRVRRESYSARALSEDLAR